VAVGFISNKGERKKNEKGKGKQETNPIVVPRHGGSSKEGQRGKRKGKKKKKKREKRGPPTCSVPFKEKQGKKGEGKKKKRGGREERKAFNGNPLKHENQ